jgi:hypothetical protein
VELRNPRAFAPPPPDPALSARFDDYLKNKYHRPSDEVQADWEMRGVTDDVKILLHRLCHRTGRETAELLLDQRISSHLRPAARDGAPLKRAQISGAARRPG